MTPRRTERKPPNKKKRLTPLHRSFGLIVQGSQYLPCTPAKLSCCDGENPQNLRCFHFHEHAFDKQEKKLPLVRDKQKLSVAVYVGCAALFSPSGALKPVAPYSRLTFGDDLPQSADQKQNSILLLHRHYRIGKVRGLKRVIMNYTRASHRSNCHAAASIAAATAQQHQRHRSSTSSAAAAPAQQQQQQLSSTSDRALFFCPIASPSLTHACHGDLYGCATDYSLEAPDLREPSYITPKEKADLPRKNENPTR